MRTPRWQLNVTWTRSVARNTRQRAPEAPRRRAAATGGRRPTQKQQPSVSKRARYSPAGRPARSAAPEDVRPGSRRVPGGGFRRFVVRVGRAELKKVEWPTQSQVIQGTIVVIIACAIVGVVPLPRLTGCSSPSSATSPLLR